MNRQAAFDHAGRVVEVLKETFPGASTRLKFGNVFELLAATILSARSTDEQVNRITSRLFKKYHSPADFAALEPEELEPLIRECGLYRAKARSIVEMSKVLIRDYGGEVPANLEDLMRLPGVGRKTANVVLSVGFGLPGLAVDTHVHRVANRLGLVSTNTPEKTEFELKSLLEPEEWGLAHHLLIWQGRAYCRARRPLCAECPLRGMCSAEKEGKL